METGVLPLPVPDFFCETRPLLVMSAKLASFKVGFLAALSFGFFAESLETSSSIWMTSSSVLDVDWFLFFSGDFADSVLVNEANEEIFKPSDLGAAD